MLEFRQNDTTAELVLTLTEKATLQAPYYLFVFTHVTTKEVVAFIKSFVEDESAYQRRYNQFTINPSVVFADTQPGEWHYRVFEQESAVNEDPDSSGAVLEYGKLMLKRATDFSYNKYDSPTQYQVYNG